MEPEARWGHGAVLCNNLVYLWGGCTSHLSLKSHDDEVKSKFMSQVFTFDTMAPIAQWDPKIASGNPPLGIRDFAAVSHGSDRLLQFGGYCGHQSCWHNSLHALYVNCDELRWEEVKSDSTSINAPMKKQDCGMVCYDAANGSSMLCVFGGAGCKSNEQWEATNELHLMNLSATEGEWIVPDVIGHPPPPCHGFSFVKITKNEVLLFGGRRGKKANMCFLNQLYLLSLNDMTWKQVNSSGPEWPVREGFSSLVVGRHVLVIGGLGNNDEALDDLWSIDTETYMWKQIGQKIPSFVKQRACHTAILYQGVPKELSILLFGGVRKFVRGEPHDKQAMMAHTAIITLGVGDEVYVNHCFDLTYMGRQALALAKEIEDLKQQLCEVKAQRNNLEKHLNDIQQLSSQSSWDSNTELPKPLSEQPKSHSLPTGSGAVAMTSDFSLNASCDDIVSCIIEVFDKSFPDLKRLFENDLESIAAEMLAVGIITHRASSFDVIIKMFYAGLSFLRDLEKIKDWCGKFYRSMYKVGGPFNMAAKELEKKVHTSLKDKFGVEF